MRILNQQRRHEEKDNEKRPGSLRRRPVINLELQKRMDFGRKAAGLWGVTVQHRQICQWKLVRDVEAGPLTTIAVVEGRVNRDQEKGLLPTKDQVKPANHLSGKHRVIQ